MIERDSQEAGGGALRAAPDDAIAPNIYVIGRTAQNWVTAFSAVDGRMRWRVEPCQYNAVAGSRSLSVLCGFGQPGEAWYLYSFDAATGARRSVGFFGLPWPEITAYADGTLFAYDVLLSAVTLQV